MADNEAALFDGLADQMRPAGEARRRRGCGGRNGGRWSCAR